MRFFLKLLIVSSVLAAGTSFARPPIPEPHQSHQPKMPSESRKFQHSHRDATMMKTSYSNDSSENAPGFKSKRMSPRERSHFRSQIKEVGRMDFYK